MITVMTQTATHPSRAAQVTRILSTAAGARLVARYLRGDALAGPAVPRHRIDELGAPRRTTYLPGLSD